MEKLRKSKTEHADWIVTGEPFLYPQITPITQKGSETVERIDGFESE